MRYLGIDYGTKKVGVALSDEEGHMGFPKGIITNDNLLMDELVSLIENEHIGGIVFGESRDYSGEENPVAREAKAVAEELSQRTGVPVAFEPEMLTTQEARRDIEGIHSHKSGDVDASAAALILTSYLSRHGKGSDHHRSV